MAGSAPYKDFKDFIARHKDQIYSKIVEYIPKPDGVLKQQYDMVRVYVDRKGQYRRPSYVLLWSLLYGGTIEDALLPAAAQQVSEDWLLMLDDFMDENMLRRGGPSAHAIYGAKYAVNAASHLHVINWKIANDAARRLGGDRGDKYINKFYDMISVTHEGQFLDMHLTYDVKDITKFTKEDYLRSIHAKTAYYTVYGPMQTGAIVAGASNSQIVDDVLDCVSTEEVLGKTIGTDVRDGVKTIILWHAVQNASSGVLKKLQEIYSKSRSEKTDEDVGFVIDTFKELGSIAYAQNEAERLAQEGLSKFDELTKDIPQSNIKDIARDSITYVARRKQ